MSIALYGMELYERMKRTKNYDDLFNSQYEDGTNVFLLYGDNIFYLKENLTYKKTHVSNIELAVW